MELSKDLELGMEISKKIVDEVASKIVSELMKYKDEKYFTPIVVAALQTLEFTIRDRLLEIIKDTPMGGLRPEFEMAWKKMEKPDIVGY